MGQQDKYWDLDQLDKLKGEQMSTVKLPSDLVKGTVVAPKNPLSVPVNEGEVCPVIRKFDTGATRDTDQDKFVYEAFISPTVLHRFAEYMHEHRFQADGSLRQGDNWQKGIPIESYRDSLVRHVMDAWRLWRYGADIGKVFEDVLCAIMFNTMGYLHELLKRRYASNQSR